MVSSALPCIATTPVTPQIRAFTAPAINLSNRAVIHREYDRWGNLTLVDDPRTQPDSTRFRAANTTPWRRCSVLSYRLYCLRQNA